MRSGDTMHRLTARAKAVDRWFTAQVDELYRVVRPASAAPSLRQAPPTRRLTDTQAS
jgi:hypothetical protein